MIIATAACQIFTLSSEFGAGVVSYFFMTEPFRKCLKGILRFWERGQLNGWLNFNGLTVWFYALAGGPK